MCKLPLALIVLLALACAAAEAQRLRIDVTYTDGHIVSGPLTPDLTELPPSVSARFVLNGTTGGTYATGDLVRSSLVFGDAAWSAADMEEFSATLTDARTGGGLAVTAFTYQYAAQNTPTSNGRITKNFPLTIEGTDIASGQPFLYRYEASSERVSMCPNRRVWRSPRWDFSAWCHWLASGAANSSPDKSSFR